MAITHGSRIGRLPINGSSVNQVLYAHVHHPPDLSGLPEPEHSAVARALAKPPEDRWPTCRGFVNALEAAAPEEPARPVTVEGATAGDFGGGPAGVTREPTTDRATEHPGTQAAAAVARHRPRLRRAGLVAAVAALAGLAATIALSRPGPIGPPVEAARPVPARPGPSLASVKLPAVAPSTALAQATPRTEGPDPTLALADRARAFLKTYCYDCHGGAHDVGEDLNVLDREVLVRVPEEKAKQPYVVPGKPGESLLWEYAGVGPKYRMPEKRAGNRR